MHDEWSSNSTTAIWPLIWIPDEVFHILGPEERRRDCAWTDRVVTNSWWPAGQRFNFNDDDRDRSSADGPTASQPEPAPEWSHLFLRKPTYDRVYPSALPRSHGESPERIASATSRMSSSRRSGP